jgi:hypothetical protein
MAKRLQITDQMTAKIQKAAGADVDVSKLAAFECIALNTLPLNKPGSLFDKARHKRAQLDLMAQYLNGNSVPMHDLHPRGDQLPVGKTFDAAVFPAAQPGEFELRSQFYLPADDDRVEKIETGILDEVSVTIKHERLECSKCGWDYMGEDASIMNLIDRTCANGHTLGKDGVELNMIGMERWYETSFVSKGAAHQPKIVGRAKALLGQEQFQRLAANGVSPELTLLTASAASSNKDTTMDLAQLVTLNSEQAVKLADAERTKAEAVAKLATAETTIAELTAKVSDLSKDNGAVTKIAALEATIASFADVGTFLIEQAKLAQVASGKTGDAVVTPVDAAAAVAIIKDSKLALANIPADGVARPAGSGDDTNRAAVADFSAFKTPKAA